MLGTRNLLGWVDSCASSEGDLQGRFNIAVGLAAQGSCVLAVDLDPQGNLSAVFGVDLEDLEESRRISMRSHSCRQLAWLLLLITSLRPFGPRRVGRGWAR